MDLVVTSDKRPNAGETVLGESFKTVPGGKGANQAVASARLGADVYMVGGSVMTLMVKIFSAIYKTKGSAPHI